jgi:hypothetical protein
MWTRAADNDSPAFQAPVVSPYLLALAAGLLRLHPPIGRRDLAVAALRADECEARTPLHGEHCA